MWDLKYIGKKGWIGRVASFSFQMWDLKDTEAQKKVNDYFSFSFQMWDLKLFLYHQLKASE